MTKLSNGGSMLSEEDKSFLNKNRNAWNKLADHGCPYTKPWDVYNYKQLRQKIDPLGIFPWPQMKKVLCVASGGGQQAPFFASLGLDITVVDISDKQLASDKKLAEQNGWHLKCVQGDVQNLSSLLDGKKYDFIYQPVSSLYIPDIQAMVSGIKHVLSHDGFYYSEHWNSTWLQLADGNCWNGHAYEIVHPAEDETPIIQTNWLINGERVVTDPVVTFRHSFVNIISALCSQGFSLEKISEGDLDDTDTNNSEPNSLGHISRYFPPMMRVLAKLRG